MKANFPPNLPCCALCGWASRHEHSFCLSLSLCASLSPISGFSMPSWIFSYCFMWLNVSLYVSFCVFNVFMYMFVSLSVYLLLFLCASKCLSSLALMCLSVPLSVFWWVSFCVSLCAHYVFSCAFNWCLYCVLVRLIVFIMYFCEFLLLYVSFCVFMRLCA